ncbi:tyrosine-type recombinase/integrase [Thauera sp. 2A1]|uniref:tyrosine-type recombinase/integrase n=1 Tax=Thauera sp. 2A1 TaxID=2570191 RepID=UPI0012923708|nr:tyrosine-type recombinase/integrase [Thauera sp. 2A1]KAI5912221.1 tyrosine-type recombinase/integrase [Thauera sp. 2A1]KAI5915046.1 tyrosine-type recombinase/integrase [Thauera sp. 2A1]
MEPADTAHRTTYAIKRQSTQRDATPAPDLFDSLERWLNTPDLAYASWLNHQRLRASTKTVYTAMFGRFCQWLQAQGRRLDTLDADDIRRFLDSAGSAPRQRAQRGRQRQQYVRQLERVFAHLGALGYRGDNVGSLAGAEQVGQGNDQPGRFLSAAECEALIALLTTTLADLAQEGKGAEAWIEYRDLALVAVMLGAGLKVRDVVGLTLNCIDLVEERIELSRPGCAHRARILGFAVAPIRAWLALQDQIHGAADASPVRKVFEADRSAGFGRLSKKVTLSASSVHRRTQKLLEGAGITGERACAQTLRNTYVGLLIDGGATDEQLIDYLGLQASISAQRLRASFARAKALPAGRHC